MKKAQPYGFEGRDKMFVTWITPSYEEPYSRDARRAAGGLTPCN